MCSSSPGTWRSQDDAPGPQICTIETRTASPGHGLRAGEAESTPTGWPDRSPASDRSWVNNQSPIRRAPTQMNTKKITKLSNDFFLGLRNSVSIFQTASLRLGPDPYRFRHCGSSLVLGPFTCRSDRNPEDDVDHEDRTKCLPKSLSLPMRLTSPDVFGLVRLLHRHVMSSFDRDSTSPHHMKPVRPSENDVLLERRA